MKSNDNETTNFRLREKKGWFSEKFSWLINGVSSWLNGESKISPAEKKKAREMKFDFAELGQIRKIIKEQIETPNPWIEIGEFRFPKPGHIFRVKEGTCYPLVSSGSLVLVIQINIQRMTFTDSKLESEATIVRLDSEGQLLDNERLEVRNRDLESIAVTDEEKFFGRWQGEVPPEQEPFRDGEAVELWEDVKRIRELGKGVAWEKYKKGLKGIIDQPDHMMGESSNEINAVYKRKRKTGLPTAIILSSGANLYMLKSGFIEIPFSEQGAEQQVYIPGLGRIQFSRSKLRRRQFDKGMLFEKIVLADETRKEILALIGGREEDLERWGIDFQKGKGDIVLAYGPPGTGKTYTGEAVAEWLEKPLYIVNSSNLGYDPRSFEQGLQEVIEKTERWNSVTIMDEAEIILESRDLGSSDSRWRVAAVLRNLERLQKGTLWLSTNRPFDIDFAIEPRIRLQIYFPPFDTERRRKVWKLTLPKNLPIPDLEETHLDELAEISLNGREIRNAIVNSVKRASSERLSYFPADYLLTEARKICKRREEFEKARKEDPRRMVNSNKWFYGILD